MSEKDSKESLSEEILSFLHLASENTIRRYLEIREVFSVRYYIPEIDFVRDEIGRCYILEANHACITLTNLLLERYCKLILIYKHSGFKTIQGLTNLEESFRPAVKLYNSMSLGETLLECKKQNIIDEEAYDFFFQRKLQFRDGFGHADAKQILRGRKARFAFGSFDNSEPLELEELTIQNIPPLHGLGIKQFAEENSYSYFVSVENLIRTTLKKYINDVFEVELEVVKLK